MSEPGNLSSPFSFNAKGEAATVEQDSQAAILAATYNVCVCEEGFRDDLPEFGVPQLAFQTVPMKLKPLEEAIVRWEPEAEPEIIEKALSQTEQGARVLTIEVGG